MSDMDTKELAELKRSLEERISELERELALCRVNIRLVDEALARLSFRPASRLIEAGANASAEPLPQPQKEPPTQHEAPYPAVQPPAEAAPKVGASAEVSRAWPGPEPEPKAKTKAKEEMMAKEEAVAGAEEPEQPIPIRSKTGEDLGTIFVGSSYVRIVPNPALRLSVRTPPFQTFFIDRVLGEMRRKDEMAVDAGSKDPMSIIEHKMTLDGETIREIRIDNIDDDARLREIRSSIRWTFERMLEKSK